MSNHNMTDSPLTVRFLALGDCNTNTTDPNQGTVPEGVCAALGNQGITVSTTNLGASMETTREGLARLLHSDTVPDLVTINFGLVDAWITSIPKVYLSYFPDNPLKRLMRKPLKFFKRYLRSRLLRRFVPTGFVVTRSEYAANVEAMIAEIRRRNPVAVIVLWSTLPVANNLERSNNLKIYNQCLQDVATQQSTVFIDTEESLATLTTGERMIDGVHLSPKAAKLIGESVVAACVNKLKHQTVLKRAAA